MQKPISKKRKFIYFLSLIGFFTPISANSSQTEENSLVDGISYDLKKKEEISFPKNYESSKPAFCFVEKNSIQSECNDSYESYSTTSTLENYIQKAALYSKKFFPMLNDGASSGQFSEILVNDGASLLVDAGNDFSNSVINKNIQKVPFFAQTSLSLQARNKSETSFSLDSLLRLKDFSTDNQGDLKTLLFSQAKLNASSSSDGATSNLGLGIRHRPNDYSLIGANAFWDYRMTDYSSSHSRLGLGGEYFRNGIELRNNWYMAITNEKTVSIGGTEYKERVVPGWDVEIGYRFPKKPELAVFARGFNWDYVQTQDNSGIEGSINWQVSPHVNIETWISNEFSASKTVSNTALPKTDETFFGIRFKLTGRPVKFKKNNIKNNLLTQMTQPVRRKYEVLIERSTGAFTNRAKGS